MAICIGLLSGHSLLANEINRFDPETLHDDPTYAQVVTTNRVKTVYISGQTAVDVNGKIVGKGNLEKQAQQSIKNAFEALKAAGATFQDVVHVRIYIKGYKKNSKSQFLLGVQKAFQDLKTQPPFAASTIIGVERFDNADALVEIELTASVD